MVMQYYVNIFFSFYFLSWTHNSHSTETFQKYKNAYHDAWKTLQNLQSVDDIILGCLKYIVFNFNIK